MLRFSGSSTRRVTQYARHRCPSTILDMRGNRSRAERGQTPRSRTTAGRHDLAARLARVLEIAAASEADYEGRPPPSATKDAVRAYDDFRNFSIEFCRHAPDHSLEFAELAASAAVRCSEMAAQAEVLVELERLYYRLEMELPDPTASTRDDHN
jgi:phage gpG-like protein